MICPYCGNENPPGSLECGFCGGPLEEKTSHAAETIPPAALDAEPVAPVSQPEPAADAPFASESWQPPLDLASTPQKKRPRWLWWLVGCGAILVLAALCALAVWAFFGLAKKVTSGEILPTEWQGLVTQVSQTLVPLTSPGAVQTLVPLSTQPGALSPTGSPGVLFYDLFSNQDGNWDQTTGTSGSTDYFESAYRIQVSADNTDVWANPANQSFADVSIEADATRNGGPLDNDFGLICRYQNVTNFYYGIISSDGYFGILKSGSDGTNMLGQDNLVASTLIDQSLDTHHMRLDCIGDQLSLYVDGQLLTQVTDSEYPTGNVGVIAGTYSQPGADILFDNFYVRQP